MAPFLEAVRHFYYCEGTVGLIDQVGGIGIAEIGTVPENTSDGPPPDPTRSSRGPCSQAAQGFRRTAAPWGFLDPRASGGTLPRTMAAWWRLDSASGNQEVMYGGNQAAPATGFHWIGRYEHAFTTWIVHLDGGTSSVDSGSGNPNAVTTGQWNFSGWSYDGNGNVYVHHNGFTRLASTTFLGFKNTVLDKLSFGLETLVTDLGLQGDLAYIMVLDVGLDAAGWDFFWNGGLGRQFPDGFIVPVTSQPELDSGREPLVLVELEQDQCRLIYGESPCEALLGTAGGAGVTGQRKCYNTRATCQDPENYDASPSIVDTATTAVDATPREWDVATGGPVEASFDVSGEETQPTGLFFKSDGTKLYIVGSNSDRVRQYPLSTAWDISTAGAVEASFIPGLALPQGIFFKPDGTKLYIVESSGDAVRQYPLSTAWDISTAGAEEASFSVASEETAPTGLFFKSDGTKLYVVGTVQDRVRQYPLSTAWDISTAGAVEASFFVTAEESAPNGIFFKSDGFKLFVVGQVSDQVHQYPLSTAWDISTAGAEEASFSVASEEVLPQAVFFKSDGTKLYVTGLSSKKVHQYPLSGGGAINDGTIGGALHVRAHAPGFGQALSFDGVNDSIEVLDATDVFGFVGTAPFTAEVILHPESVPASVAQIMWKIFTNAGGLQGWSSAILSDGNFIFQRFRDGAFDRVSALITIGEPHVWSGVYDGTDLILYEDGVEKDRTASSKSMVTNGAALMIGNDSVGGTSVPYHGTMDDIRIWNVARTQAQIRERMVLPLSGRETGLVGYWPLDTDPPPIATRTLRFTKPQTSLSRSLFAWPFLVDVQTAPTRLNPGGGSRDRGVLGDRASVDLVFQDAPGSDRVVDKYRAQRISGTAQVDEGGYEPLDRGAFWAKWRARNQFFQNRRLRILEGFVGQLPVEMQRRDYFVDSLAGPDSDGRVRLRAKDVLKLADDERAQAPPPTPGELNAALTDTEATSFQATGALVSDYPDAPGLVRIGDEIIEYQTRTQVTPDNVEFGTLTRGARGSTAAAHDAEDRVQRCLEFINVLPWKLAEDLLVNFGNVPQEFIPITDWDAEGGLWLSQFTLSARITEPTSVTELLSEITQQAQFFVWWDEHAQEIKLRALRPPTEDPVVLDDTSHIIENTSSLSEDPKQRLSQVWVFFKQKDPTKDLDEESNYARVRIRADLEAESPEQYGESRVKKIFSRWLETEGQVIQITKRTLDRFRDNPRMLRLSVDAKDRDLLRVGEIADVVTRTILDDRGATVSTRWLIVSTREEPPGERVNLELLESEFTGRFAFYMESTAPTFATATESEKKSGAWYAKDDGKMPDGSAGYQYQ